MSCIENSEFGLTKPSTVDAGWQSGATSVDFITTSSLYAGVRFRSGQTNRNAMVGLGYNDSSTHFASIEYGVFVQQTGQALVYESGYFRAILGVYTPATHIEVRVSRAGSVQYVIGGVVGYVDHLLVSP